MRNFANVKRIVIKIGTNTLSKDGAVDSGLIRRIAAEIAKLHSSGKKVIIVTSGAIGLGAMKLKLAEHPCAINMRQACAAIGQPILMQEYSKAFAKFNITVAQALITADVLNNRKTYLNLRNSIDTLLKIGVIPVVNENDNVSTEEIGSTFGDNDTLSALVASKIDADLLIMLTDIDALYDKDPRQYPDAKPIPAVFEINGKIISSAGTAGSRHSVGGMKTKIRAAQIASDAGCRIVLACGRAGNVISRIMEGENIGTIFLPKRRLSNRRRWLLNSTPAGTVIIDSGAVAAIRKHKSLLPSGITEIHGHFSAGSVVMINNCAKAMCNFSSAELKSLIGKHSSEIRKIFSPQRKDVVAEPENIVFLDYD